MPYFVVFSSFAHQTARESTEIAHPRGIRPLVMVVTRKCKDPVYKPPPHFLPNPSMHKGGGGRNCGILQYSFHKISHTLYTCIIIKHRQYFYRDDFCTIRMLPLSYSASYSS